MTERPRPVNHDEKWTRRCALEAAAIFMAGLRDVSPAAVEAAAVEFERHLDRPVDGTVAKTPAPPYAPPFAVANAWAPSPIAYPAPPVDPAMGEETMKEQHERIQAASHDPHEGREPEVANMVEGQKTTVRWSTGNDNAGSFMAATGVVHLREFGLEVEIPDPAKGWREDAQEQEKIIAALREQLQNERTYLTRKLSHEEARRGEYYAEIVQLKGDLARALGIAAGSSAQTITEATRQRTENLEKKTNQLAYERNRHQARLEEHDDFRKQVCRALDIDEHVQLATIVEAARQRTVELDKVLGGLDTTTALLRKTEDEKHQLQEKLDRLTVNQLPLQEKIAGYDQFAADVATSLNLEPSAAPNVVMNILRARLSECGDSANPIMRQGDLSYATLVEKLGGKQGDSIVTLAGRVRHQRDNLKADNEDLEKELDEVRLALGAGNADSGVDWYSEHEDTVDAARRVRAKADGRTSQEEKS